MNGELLGEVAVDHELALVSDDGVAAPYINVGGVAGDSGTNSCGMELRFVRVDAGILDMSAILDLHVPNGVWKCCNKVRWFL